MKHDYNHIFHTLASKNCILLTPNRRLSAYLHKQYNNYQTNLNQKAWPTPLILPINTYMQKLWQDHSLTSFDSTPILLNSIQENYIWESIVKNSMQNHFLLRITETARHAKTAWQLLKQWCIEPSDVRLQSDEGSHFLLAWLNDFAATCAKNNYIDTTTIIDKLIDLISQGKIQLPEVLIFSGFNEFTPQLTRFMNICREKNCEISFPQQNTNQNHYCKLSLQDADDELLTAARWIKSLSTENPDKKIACVVPNLDKIRDYVKQVFHSVFADSNIAINISAGKRLSTYPLIQTALQILKYTKNCSLENFNQILFSPFIGASEQECHARYQFDVRLRKANLHRLYLPWLVQAQIKNDLSLLKHCPKLATIYTSFLNYVNEIFINKNSYSDWASIFTQALTLMGWPGERSLESEEYQTMEQWQELLLDFQSLDHITNEVDYHTAIQTLEDLAANRVFQAQTPEASIHILGLLEAAGMPFDHLWLMGVDDLSWPAQPSPHPLLPKSLQRMLNMPHATAERELQYCQGLLQQFKNNCKQLICSHAQQKDDLLLQASPLITDFVAVNKQELTLLDYEPEWQTIFSQRNIEYLTDDIAPELQIDEKIIGGTSILKNQAACPFRAFAECRLHAQALETTKPGLNARERGIILHKTLELIWKELKDHHSLISMNEDDLNTFITKTINQVFVELRLSQKDDSQYISLEKVRLAQIIQEWLAIEKKRSPFKVSAQELTAQMNLNKLNINLRIDRIDELADGKKLLIDYKTGRHNEISHWFGERPDEPQLPLYMLLDAENTIALTFAQISRGDYRFKGVSHTELEIDGIKPYNQIKQIELESWSGAINQWQSILTRLSDEFCQGIAGVAPKDGEKTCTWCNLKSLCRVNDYGNNE